MKEFIVKEKYNENKIENIIKKEFPSLSSNSLNKLFRLKDIKVNEKRVQRDFIVYTGDHIKIFASDDILYGNTFKIDYIYEDDNILVAYKPKGIVSCNSDKSFESMVKKDKGNNITICHRLDTNTEGLLIFCKNISILDELLSGFKNSNIHKEYLTLVYGNLKKKKDILKAFIVKDTKTAFSKVVDKEIKGGQNIITEYEVIKYFSKSNVSLLNIKLHTGRTHQIRAHMKHIGHNVIGDSKYGINEINRKLKVKSQILVAYKYTFSFDKTSILSYLNNVTIELPKEKINKIFKWLDI